MRPRFSLVALLTAAFAQGAFPQGNPDSSALFQALAGRDTLALRGGIRALGRLERPPLAERLLPFLSHPLPGVRAEAAQAVAQAAQGFRGDSSLERRGRLWPALVAALGERVEREGDPAALGVLALSLGRLPYLAAGEIHEAETRLLRLWERGGENPAAQVDLARGLEMLARLASRRFPLGEAFLSRAREAARSGQADARVRRHALGALLAAQAADDSTLQTASRAADPGLRRLALTAPARVDASAERRAVVEAALADSSPMVRIESLRAWQRTAGAQACERLAVAAADSVPRVALVALDLLGGCGGDTLAVRTLLAAGGGWHPRAHALVSLARAAPERARALLPRALGDSVWQMRMYAARAAALLGDSAALRRLARDPTANVREAALSGLAQVSGHAADAVYRGGLDAPDYQLVRSAANALAGSPDRDAAAAALVAALQRITAQRRETSRDPRLAILTRVHELGGPALARRLAPYLGDFDPVIAESVATILTEWTGRPHRAAPRPPPRTRVSSVELERLRGARLRFTMANGGGFEVALLVDAAPRTVFRVVSLARRGYYDGLTFHRVVPNFVIQGGSPGANEYMGDGPFMPDEVGSISHQRGTLGISTRGRDTGDAQLFVNLVDNPRLDYEYTVWGRVVAGMAVVDAVLEGDVIRRVEMLPR